MAHCKKHLLALMAVEGIPTVWFTLSLANHRWEDLQNLFTANEEKKIQESEDEYNTRCNNTALINYSTNPNLVDAMFVRRVKHFVAFFFGENCLDANWIWYRYEWQKRGNIHVHGLAKLKSDPGLSNMFFINCI